MKIYFWYSLFDRQWIMADHPMRLFAYFYFPSISTVTFHFEEICNFVRSYIIDKYHRQISYILIKNY